MIWRVDNPAGQGEGKPLAAQGGQISLTPSGASIRRPIRAQPAAPGVTHGRLQLNGVLPGAQRGQSSVNQLLLDALGPQLCAQTPVRNAAAMQGPGPGRGIGRVVEQPRFDQARDQAFDPVSSVLRIDAVQSHLTVDLGHHQTSDVGTRRGVAIQVIGCPALQTGRGHRSWLGPSNRPLAVRFTLSHGGLRMPQQPIPGPGLRAAAARTMSSAMQTPSLSSPPPSPRIIGAVNWRGLWTLYMKEVRRFLNVYTQTLVAPMVTTLLFLAIFTLALGRSTQQIGGVAFASFLAPGLIMMSMIQNAFANTSSTIVIAKVQGNIVDLLMPPLSPAELTMGLTGGGVSRGVLVGVVVGLALWAFVPLGLHAPWAIVYFGINAALMLALLGMIGGIWAEKFDHIAAVTNFVIMPFSFLSGTFYSIERLPEAWQAVALLNPFFYLIDGFRYGFIGHADGSLVVGAVLVLSVNLGLWWLTHRMIASGYRLKA